MRANDLIEKVNLSFPGSNHIIDYRDPNAKDAFGRKFKTFITFTKDGGAMIWNYGSGNIVAWYDKEDPSNSLTTILGANVDTAFQRDYGNIRFTKTGVLLPQSRRTGVWAGDRNVFSLDNKPFVERLLDLGIITPRTPIFVGNWAKDDSDAVLLGSAASIMNAPSIPNTITLYHGTSNARAKEILENGLAPLEGDARIWTKNTNAPDHRAESVYLTASLGQAEYYANKAVKIDRKRLSFRFRTDQEYKITRLIHDLNAKKYWNSISKNPDIAEEDNIRKKIETVKKSNEVLKKMANTVDKVAPVILAITLTRADYKRLMADDDYLAKMRHTGGDTSPTNWRGSLSDFGQVAYRGTIPPDRIKIIK